MDEWRTGLIIGRLMDGLSGSRMDGFIYGWIGSIQANALMKSSSLVHSLTSQMKKKVFE